MNFKVFWHGLVVVMLPVIFAVFQPFLTAFHLPQGHEWVIITCSLIVPFWGYVKKLQWFGASAAFSWFHTMVVTLMVAGIDTFITILTNKGIPTKSDWIIIIQTAVGAFIGYVVKGGLFGSSGGLPITVSPNTSTTP